MKKISKVLVLALIVFLTACSSSSEKKEVMMATTTSMNDSGLLDKLAPAFKEDTGIELKWDSVGSGEAIKKAKDGDVELLFAHSPKDEKALVEAGGSEGRTEIMYNNFLFVGPEKLAAKDLKTAAKTICDSKTYVSRDDESGTHKKEIATFEEYCGTKEPKDVIKSGVGMLDTLNIANEKKAYTLTDIATWLANKDKLDLVEAYYNKEDLVNTYSIHVVKNEKLDAKRLEYANEFKKWITEGKGLEIIKDYGVEEYKEPLFTMIIEK